MAIDADDQLILAYFESAQLAPTAWETWLQKVEALLGSSADGDQREDGYSLDGFYLLWEARVSPEEAIGKVKEIVFS